MFKVEDGTGLSDSNSYGTVAAFVLYWADRGTDYSDTDAELIQQALIRASDYIDSRFSARFKGLRLVEGQALAWPRKYAFDGEGYALATDAVPARVKYACFQYAKRAMTKDLQPDPTANPNVVQESKTIGPIHTSVTYSGNATATKVLPWPAADALLMELVRDAGGSTR